LGLWGTLGGLLPSGSSRVLRHKADGLIVRPNVTENASALVATESEKSKQFAIAVFSKSVVLRTKVPFNESEVIALEVQFACEFGLIDLTLPLRSHLHCRASLVASGSAGLTIRQKRHVP